MERRQNSKLFNGFKKFAKLGKTLAKNPEIAKAYQEAICKY